MQDEKICPGCGWLLPADKFGLRTGPNGSKHLKRQCKKCESSLRQQVRNEKRAPKTKREPRPVEATRKCLTCEKVLPIDRFFVSGHDSEGHAFRRRSCGVCVNSRRKGQQQIKRRMCKTCRVKRSTTKFADISDRKCQICKDAEAPPPATPDDARADAEYDYKFARTILGMSKFAALAWLVRGYKDQDEDSIYEWNFHLEDADIEWQPDEYIGDDAETADLHPSTQRHAS